MRPVRHASGIAVLVFALAACTSADPGWTYAPPPSDTPAPSGQPSGEPSSPAPSGAVSPAPSGAVSPGPSVPAGDVVQVSAASATAFDQSTLTVPADTPFQIEFANNEQGVPHNVEIKNAAGESLFRGDIFNGVETRTYDAPALTAGSYQFICSVHPNMIIEVTAE